MRDRTIFTGPNGEMVSGDAGAVATYARICREMEDEKSLWIDGLRRDGVKMAHPDDGWVNRTENRLMPCYPQFDDRPGVGDIIALGSPDKWRLVRVIKIEPALFHRDREHLFFELIEG